MDGDQDPLEKHQLTMLKALEGPVVEVVVGVEPTTTTWTIPKALLSAHSDFFRKANNGFKESLDNKINLPDVDVRVFRLFVEWLYCGKNVSSFHEFIDVPGVDEDLLIYWLLWILGDRLMSRDFKNFVMTFIYNHHGFDGPGFSIVMAEEVDYCWSNTPQNSKLRSLIIDSVAMSWTRKQYGDDWKQGFATILPKYPDLQLALLYKLPGPCEHEEWVSIISPVEHYLEPDRKVMQYRTVPTSWYQIEAARKM
ncbi:hypothetical protein ACN47E_005357 [Coniothyrium glycines]